MTRQFGFIGVPSSAGAHTPGIDKAPKALREAGIVEQLQQAGCQVIDHGDLPRTRYTPDKDHPKAQNLERVVDVAAEVAKQVGAMLKASETPLVLGGIAALRSGLLLGMCSMTPAFCWSTLMAELPSKFLRRTRKAILIRWVSRT